MPPIKLKDARILITNDDGYFADGLKLLKEIAEQYSNDVWVVAPEVEKSGASHALTFKGEMKLKMHNEKFFSLDGTPSDCVAIGLDRVLTEARPDLILSGINSGCNLGEDVTYSGTIAAAMEGIIRKIPSIAISQNYESGKKNEIVWGKPPSDNISLEDCEKVSRHVSKVLDTVDAYFGRHGMDKANSFNSSLEPITKYEPSSNVQIGNANPQNLFFEIIQSPILSNHSCSLS